MKQVKVEVDEELYSELRISAIHQNQGTTEVDINKVILSILRDYYNGRKKD